MVVLPTPPEPQHTTTSAVEISASRSLISCYSQPFRQFLDRVRIECLSSDQRQPDLLEIERLGQPLRLVSMQRASRVAELGGLVQRGAGRGPVERQIVALVEGVDHHRPQPQATLVAQ